MVVIGRLIKGLAMGILSSLIPVYVAETIVKKASSISFVQLNAAISGLAMYYIAYFFPVLMPNEYSFRFAWAIEALPAIAIFILSFFLPESPKWLATKSRWGQAAKNLDKIKAYQNGKPQEKTNRDDREYVLRAYTSGPEIRNSSYDKIFGKKYWKHTVLGISTQVFVQLTSVQVLMNYFLFICELCGIEEHSLIFVSSALNVVQVIFTLVPLFILDNTRRRDSLTFGLIILSVSFLALFIIILTFGEHFTHEGFDLLFRFEMFDEPASAVLAIFLFINAVYSSTVLSASWLYAGELFPGPARAKGASICMCASWMVNTTMGLVLPILFKYIGPWTFATLALFSFVGGIALMFLPETRDLGEYELYSIFNFNNEPFPRQKLVSDKKKKKSKEAILGLESKEAVVNKPQFEHALTYEQQQGNGKVQLESLTGGFTTSPTSETVTEIETGVELETAREYMKPFSSETNSALRQETDPDSSQVEDILDIYTSGGALDEEDAISPNTYYSSDWSQGYQGVQGAATTDNYEEEEEEEAPAKISLISSKSSTRESTMKPPQSGNAYFHANREGSPIKAGLTYEPTTFLQFDSLRVALRTNILDRKKSEAKLRENANSTFPKGGVFISSISKSKMAAKTTP